ncbi:MAG: mucoidy inhibitor MuiA family protein [Planctomycetes bacterium]|nr:mucoidy inhibitor MuiA family protein [Planctomycetota bacterium]
MKIPALSGIIAVFIVVSGLKTTAAETKQREESSFINKVTVYLDRAHVRRTSNIELKKGVELITFKDLPVNLADDSVRAGIADNSGIRLLGFEVRLYSIERTNESRVQTLQTDRQKLTDDIREIDDTIAALASERDFIQALKASYVKEAASTIMTEKPKIEDWQKLLKFVRNELIENSKQIAEEESKKRNLSEKLRVIDNELSILKTLSALHRKSVTITLECTKDVKTQLELSYMIFGAGWAPSYDCYADKSNQAKQLELYYYGHVWQNTGEDWSNVELLLSTAHPAFSASMPTLSALVLGGAGKDSQRSYPTSQISYQKDLLIQNSARLERFLGKEATVDSKQQELCDIIKSESEERFASYVFTIQNKETIPSDGMPHKSTIAVLSLPSTFEYITTPKLAPYAYLKANTENNAEFPLLPARFNIFLSNNYIGESVMKMAVPREKFEAFLGIDEGIKVQRVLDDKKDDSSSLTRQINYTFKTTIENLKKEKIKLTVIDQIPIARDSDIKISIVDGTTKPAEQLKDGTLKWIIELEPSKSTSINLLYYIYCPMAKNVAGLE